MQEANLYFDLLPLNWKFCWNEAEMIDSEDNYTKILEVQFLFLGLIIVWG